MPYIGPMDFANLFETVFGVLAEVPRSGLLLATLCAIAAGVLATMLRRISPGTAGLLRGGSTLALMGILVMVVIQVSRFDPRFELAVPEIGLPHQEVLGGETRIPLARDGHFWITADVNGQPVRLLVDTGATLTAVSPETARLAGLEPRTGGLPVRMQTANGTVSADMTSIDELRFGNIAARGLDAVIAPNLGRTNVVGMNFLSRLAGWRVENNTLILVPHNPQEEWNADVE